MENNVELVNARNDLLKMYEKWAKELKEIKDINFTSEDFSMPYYSFVPDNWFDTGKIRIMIIGEEGRGNWSKEWRSYGINEIIGWAKKHIQERLDHTNETLQKSEFWDRIESINNIDSRIVFVWSNLDKIHHNGTKGCALGQGERKLLHGTETKILAEEIRILKPTIVVFCGWKEGRKLIFESEFENDKELSGLYDKFFKKDKYDYKDYKEDGMINLYKVTLNATDYFFTYHPNYKNRKYKPDGYENFLIEKIKESTEKNNY